MRKTKLFKRSAAVVLSSAMVISSVNAIPGTQKEASAADYVIVIYFPFSRSLLFLLHLLLSSPVFSVRQDCSIVKWYSHCCLF